MINIRNLLFFLLMVLIGPLSAKNEPTTTAIERFETLDFEIRHHVGCAGTKLVECSKFQEAWLDYLHEAESQEEFLKGMELLHARSTGFRRTCHYLSSAINFYNPYNPDRASPQYFLVGDKNGYLNTYKAGRQLTDKERETYFSQEFSQYLREGIASPFILDSEAIDMLQEGVVYNFVVHFDGTIKAAQERPGAKEYHVRDDQTVTEKFLYPNHTILAGSPHEPIAAGGALIVYKSGDKKLFFISNKSGHFLPEFHSLIEMRQAMEKLGVNPYTVIAIPDVDIARAAIKLYRHIQIPLWLDQEDHLRLFQQARQRWLETLDSIDEKLLTSLSNGDFSALTPETIDRLNRQREEAAYMRSAYSLFSREHQPPKSFHKFVKKFGKLKDAIKHNAPEKIASEATVVLEMLNSDDAALTGEQIMPGDAASFWSFLQSKLTEMDARIKLEALSVEEFHAIKKWSRELGVLFLYLREDNALKGNHYFLYRAISLEFFEINEILTEIHDNYVKDELHGKTHSEDYKVALPESAKSRLNRHFESLRIAPPCFRIKVVPEHCFKLINYAKEWYPCHSRIGKHPDEPDDRDMYDPRALILLDKISQDKFRGIKTEDDRAAIAMLSKTLRFAEIAQHALYLSNFSCSSRDNSSSGRFSVVGIP